MVLACLSKKVWLKAQIRSVRVNTVYWSLSLSSISLLSGFSHFRSLSHHVIVLYSVYPTTHALWARPRIQQLYPLQKRNTYIKKRYPGYDTTDGVFWSSGEYAFTPSLPLLPGLLWPEVVVVVVVAVRVLCVSDRSIWTLFVLERNTWNHITVYKLLY